MVVQMDGETEILYRRSRVLSKREYTLDQPISPIKMGCGKAEVVEPVKIQCFVVASLDDTETTK
jgi:hypothetical protein